MHVMQREVDEERRGVWGGDSGLDHPRELLGVQQWVGQGPILSNSRVVVSVQIHPATVWADHPARRVMCRAREGLCSPVWTRDGIFTAVALREMIFTTPKERETRVEPATFGRVCLGKEDQVPPAAAKHSAKAVSGCFQRFARCCCKIVSPLSLSVRPTRRVAATDKKYTSAIKTPAEVSEYCAERTCRCGRCSILPFEAAPASARALGPPLPRSQTPDWSPRCRGRAPAQPSTRRVWGCKTCRCCAGGKCRVGTAEPAAMALSRLGDVRCKSLKNLTLCGHKEKECCGKKSGRNGLTSAQS
eukprot:m.196019 g.196019  ORF g.196019 m.196019 type:complete len:302 (+) comp15245_c0_seq5:1220-2125(+)